MITRLNKPETQRWGYRQKGAALAVSLLILMVMTVLGISAMSTTTLQERMANNHRQNQLAFQSAEAALRTAEAWLVANVTGVTALRANFNNAAPVAGLYSERSPVIVDPTRPLPAGVNLFDDTGWLAAGNAVAVNTVNTATLTQSPRYIIQYVGRVGPPPKDYSGKKPDKREYGFRITAIGWGEGANPTSRYLLQSNFRIPLL